VPHLGAVLSDGYQHIVCGGMQGKRVMPYMSRLIQ
jgi:hypothetical protein